jgi:hypothetical protein
VWLVAGWIFGYRASRISGYLVAKEESVALVRSWRAVQAMGSVRVAGLLGAIAGALALSGPSCGGAVASPAARSMHATAPEGGAVGIPSPEAEPPNADNGTDAESTVLPPANPVSDDDAAAEPALQGGGAPCSASATVTVGTKVTVSTSWPGTAGVAKGAGPFLVWMLSIYDVDASNRITGTTTTCEMQMPSLTLTVHDALAIGAPSGTTALQAIVFPTTSWNGVASTNVTGTLGGWNVGSSVAIAPVVLLYGLKSTSGLASTSTQWPTSASMIASADLTYADGMAYQTGIGQPGILGTYKSTPPYYMPGTSLAPSSPSANQASLVFRTELRLYGTSSSCATQSGQAFVNLLNGRIVGCQLTGSAGPCTTSQSGFLDANETQFEPGTGTFTSQQLSAGASCIDVLSALP